MPATCSGNIWKFDLTASSAGSWNVAYGGTPLYTAAGRQRQPPAHHRGHRGHEASDRPA